MSLQAQRTDLQPQDISLMIQQRGLTFQYYQASLCTCTAGSGNPNPVCPYCNGTGWQYNANGNIQALISGLNKTALLSPTGLDWNGTAFLTTLPTNRLGYRDKLILKTAKIVYCEIIQPAGTPKYPVVFLQSAITTNSSGALVTLVQGTDLTVTNDTITWINQPVNPVSLRYLTYPAYLVMDFPHSMRGTIIQNKSPILEYHELPIQATVKLEWLLRTGDTY